MFEEREIGVRKGRGWQEKSGRRALKATFGLQYSINLETRSPRCPELIRHSHREREEICDSVEDVERRGLPGNENTP